MVVLPDPYSSYNYKIRVSTWGGVMRSVSACSSKFEIRGRDRPEYTTPSPTDAPVDGETDAVPREPGALPAGVFCITTAVSRPRFDYAMDQATCVTLVEGIPLLPDIISGLCCSRAA